MCLGNLHQIQMFHCSSTLAADKWNGLNCVEESLPQKHWDGGNVRSSCCGRIYIRPKVKQEDICPKVQQEVNVIHIEIWVAMAAPFLAPLHKES